MTLTGKLTVAVGVVAVGWALLILIWGPAPFAFSFDDAYYYFTIGRNWAEGSASTFDGIAPTNGYHPLWQLIAIGPFLVGLDDTAAVRALLVFQLALWAGAMVIVARVIGAAVTSPSGLPVSSAARRFRDRATLTVFVLLCVTPFLFTMTVNGLESGLVVPVGALLITHALRFRGRFVSLASAGQRWVGGVLLALAFLARTDAVILIVVLAAWCILDRGHPPLGFTRHLRALVELFAVPVVVVGVYLIVNRIVFGTPLQISGVVKRLPLTTTRAVSVVVWAAIGIAVLVLARRRVRRTTRLSATRRFFTATGWYATFCVGLLGYYATLQQVPYLWYFAPLALYAMFLVPLVVADLARSAALEAGGGADAFQVRARIPAGILVVTLLAGVFWSLPGFVDPGTRALLVHDARAGRWIDANLPADARLAAWDAGALGYFGRRSITSLDGVVNTLEWHDAAASGGRPDFLAARDIGWVTNHGGAVDGVDPHIDDQIRALFGTDRIRDVEVVYADTYPYSGTLDGSRTDRSTKAMGSWVYRLER